MNKSVIEVLRRVGLPPSEMTPDLVQEIETVLAEAAATPVLTVARVLAARRECQRAATAAAEMKGILEGLLRGPVALCICEGVRQNGDETVALVRMRGELSEVPVHPSVDADALRDLEPWQLARVHAKENVVVGVVDDRGAFERAHGEVVEVKEVYEDSDTLVQVTRPGGQEEVVRLARELRDDPPRPRDRLVLSRDLPSWAIARAPAIGARSRFEVPIASVAVGASAVAGLDGVLHPLLEEIELRLLRTDMRDRFALEPMRGILLWSLKPGEGKTLLTRLVATWLDGVGRQRGIDVVLYVVKPNELKSMWHGEDARIVRDDLCGSIRARQLLPRTRPLLQLVVMDEIDALGRRAGGQDGTAMLSGAHNDAIQALLVEQDGMVQTPVDPPAQVLWLGLTNRPDAVDPALKRPGRFGDLVLEMPATTVESGAHIMAVYAPTGVPWLIDGAIDAAVDGETLRRELLRPALSAAFDTVVLRYSTDAQRGVEVTAGSLMSAVHFREAMTRAKLAAARRAQTDGLPAVAYDDVFLALVGQALAAARQMEADWLTLQRCLRVRGRVQQVEVVAHDEVAWQRDLVMGDVVRGDVAVGDRGVRA